MIRAAALALSLALLLSGCIDIALPESHYQREIFTRTVEGNPSHAHAHFSLGRRAMYEGEYRDAISHFESAAAAEPELLEAWLGMGRCWLNLDRPAYALEPLETALGLAPDSPRAHEMMGQALMETDRTAEAEEHLRRALALDPGAFLALAKLGEIAYMRGDLEGAIDLWRGALDCDPTDPEWRNAQRQLEPLLRDLEAYTARHPD